MSRTTTFDQTTRTAPSSAAPVRTKTTRQLVDEALRGLPPVTSETPSWSHRLLPATVRGLLADLGLWQDPTPQRPSVHLEQVLAVLRRYGWCQSLDVTATGRLCIRGAMNVLEKTGHVTPQARDRAVHYLQQTLHQAGITMQYFAWNDLPDQQFSTIQTLLEAAARTARENGE
ncbi:MULTISPECIES: hypothetical protein [unclassified Streptomyces]|uniref:DUF6197 family protein n=1 Tax=unclassified Streptomyces TaxID=2593676 RepID=UPI00088CFD1F|nr:MULTISPECIES: hypothetical protein [unclassified Streptomyces]PBC72268.1 hypothetical protein BX261_7352 [Streptomyces sp. 2321.6]SDR61904.1 hypothetical protein SAMN05216511_7217 [Streptomyces sp. KS_16]SEE48777.1 hypothetical protein SAMN05428940_7266 [Streptomyces sp. 2133.1]SNC77773.1 hypothetical protein SAMN06272741_7189 [Streptomyces sp. 2114.4]